MKFSLKTSLLVAILATSACATEIPWDGGDMPSLQVGMSRSQVEAAFGPPTREFVDPEGYRTWSYVRMDGGEVSERAATELTVRFAGDRVYNFSHTKTTTTVTSP